ncbi:hypothetical protein ACFQY4_23160 [Catellatospora bangladeshensis]|uniref:Uncharacterized protein n=1 Tax=Catellatospora bangladeshensis TaxID=310355 RepID=A0A8J3JCU1_9ACTN|nr:hypothetical protein [Catellatospora bangladeshensis]GIF80309.1 hypothetical protein Cba03nite_16580 [Catellatospora bangladeshensis]
MGADLSPRLRELPERPAVIPVPAWHGFFADPDGFAGHLARAAVAQLGDQARDWFTAHRANYPAGLPGTTAYVAHADLRHRFLFTGPIQAVGALTAADAVTEWSELAWWQAMLALHIAAVFGADPTDQARVRDLLTLWRVRGEPPPHGDFPAPDEARLRELTPRLALSLGRLTGRRSSRQAEFVPDPSWGTLRQLDARTLMPLANRAVKHFRALV